MHLSLTYLGAQALCERLSAEIQVRGQGNGSHAISLPTPAYSSRSAVTPDSQGAADNAVGREPFTKKEFSELSCLVSGVLEVDDPVRPKKIVVIKKRILFASEKLKDSLPRIVHVATKRLAIFIVRFLGR